MQFGNAPTPCRIYTRSETEDYTVVIVGTSARESNSLTDNKRILANEVLKFFPNPVSDILYIKGITIDKRNNLFIEIYDIAGKK